MLAELLIRMVQATVISLNIQPLAGQEATRRELLVPPLTPGNYETSSCWLGVRLRRPFLGTIKGNRSITV